MNIVPRGSSSVHKALFDHQQQEGKTRKGRSLKLILQRNECLLDRYLFYGHVTGKRYELILKKLSTEFFLSESTIGELLSANYPMLSSLKKTYQGDSPIKFKKTFENKWPHLSWEEFR